MSDEKFYKNVCDKEKVKSFIAKEIQSAEARGEEKAKEINQMMFQVPIGGGEIKVIECGKCKSARQDAFAEIERWADKNKLYEVIYRGDGKKIEVVSLSDLQDFIKENKTR